ncbi:hypothetical protein BT63DRAFT_422925 [Microthyrium microscopicum]|uniref:PhoD-like phosphatase domain-containing protein n=1 Tax=Microthyrium microscopicum TaxID=703497 RepID=A0A6A6UJL8_9PEZI|nr:hypothetical protein BT63DRAFT_422925 [Microthyrium microscopicum]
MTTPQPILDNAPIAPANGTAITNGNGAIHDGPVSHGDVICGPLINYKRMSNELTEQPLWHGSVLIVTRAGLDTPELRLGCIGSVSGKGPEGGFTLPTQTFPGEKLYEDSAKTFYRFVIQAPIQDFEAKWEYSLSQNLNVAAKVFVIPSKQQSMRILFHSCNGFSVGTDEDAWSGPALWNDVNRVHATKPFHVMIGGGDQIYNDNVRVTGPLREWTDIGDPIKRRNYLFNEDMRLKCDEHYYNNYIRWYGQEPFKSANCIIPQINIWDDHDIIDGFGSYTDHFMKCHVFRGIGGVAHKYYLLFQHHIAPPPSTFTSDHVASQHAGGAPDPVQLEKSFVLSETVEDPSFIIGRKPGPYVEEPSRSIYCQLGARIGFIGVDARQERTRHQVNYPETYDLIFDRLTKEYTAHPELQHLVVLLGVPIAYPRLTWLENILSSPLIAPIKFLNKRFGLGGSLFNKFDGKVDLLDDLDDHYTARQHKHERCELVQRLQVLAKQFNVRVTILGGDVHLAAVGRFYSKPSLKIPAEQDWRYMVNVISSAITNKPPPSGVANLLARRNKIHHLDHETDETLLECFDHDPGMAPNSVQHTDTNVARKTKDTNHATMPSRNYAIITESQPLGAEAQSVHSEHPALNTNKPNMRKPMHDGEKEAGTTHPAASGVEPSGRGGQYGLDVTFRVEISNKDKEGNTEGYGFTIPGLNASAYAQEGTKW